MQGLERQDQPELVEERGWGLVFRAVLEVLPQPADSVLRAKVSLAVSWACLRMKVLDTRRAPRQAAGRCRTRVLCQREALTSMSITERRKGRVAVRQQALPLLGRKATRQGRRLQLVRTAEQQRWAV